jgi:2-polyprenyl-6-hydroxyphenyl methylase / 3-demethylubiquinone-9 3-methyltransferase
MPVDNAMYDRLSHTWWEEGGFLNFLRAGVNPVRFGYMRRVLTEELGLDPDGLRVLDVGCGGGLLAEEFARLGCGVTGVDPSRESVEVARRHAAAEGLAIEYETGTGEQLPFEAASFDAAYCCDVLEHVDSVPATIEEIGRVLRPGGLFLYDTTNRTARSRLLMIKLAQDWSLTRWAEPDLHDWDMFIRPAELERTLGGRAFEVRDRVGIAPRRPLAAVKAMRDRARGSIDYAEMGRRIDLRESRDQSGLYAGYAIKL